MKVRTALVLLIVGGLSYVAIKDLDKRTPARLAAASVAPAVEPPKVFADDLSGRKRYAEELERKMLKDGLDFEIDAQGDKGTTLRIKFVQINRPYVYNFSDDRDLIAALRANGFRKVVLTDGSRQSWTVDLSR